MRARFLSVALAAAVAALGPTVASAQRIVRCDSFGCSSSSRMSDIGRIERARERAVERAQRAERSAVRAGARAAEARERALVRAREREWDRLDRMARARERALNRETRPRVYRYRW